MQKAIFFLVFLISGSLCLAQTEQQNPKNIKSIEVSGSAEMEVIPDDLFFSVVLKEYMDGKNRVGIEKLEAELEKAVAQNGISKENLQVENVFGYQWTPNKKATDFLTSKGYVIRVSNPNKIDAVLAKVDPKGINQVYLKEYRHTKIETYKRDLKLQALKNAKEKAKYLLDGIGEQLGEALHIAESEIPYQQPMYANSRMMMKSESDGMSNGGDISFQTIKLTYDIRAEFRIK
ncbi:MAG TPA: SIMPL domain-containing protein [Cytophagaceae bacterium]|jgi:hypothetical protein